MIEILAIIQILQANPETSRWRFSKKLGLSQPSVSAGLKRLKKSGIFLASRYEFKRSICNLLRSISRLRVKAIG
ncbi:MAG: winged helix-turn-helix transcriptional regulator [Nitrososphaerales archaeon]